MKIKGLLGVKEGILEVAMWKYRCPICKEIIREDVQKDDVSRLMRHSHVCPNCGGKLYVKDTGACVDLGAMIMKALEINMGIVISKEDALKSYVEV